MKITTILPLLLTCACVSPAAQDTSATSIAPESSAPVTVNVREWSYQPDLPVGFAPFETLEVQWKQRLDLPYVFVEYTGSYTETGRLLPALHQSMQDQGLVPDGPPFGLYYDDPGRVPVDKLRSRACVPVAHVVETRGELSFDVLPSTTVAYAVVGGAYPEVPRAYPKIFAYMAKIGWVENGPIREIYLVPPGSVSDYSELITEVQIPVGYER